MKSDHEAMREIRAVFGLESNEDALQKLTELHSELHVLREHLSPPQSTVDPDLSHRDE